MVSQIVLFRRVTRVLAAYSKGKLCNSWLHQAKWMGVINMCWNLLSNVQINGMGGEECPSLACFRSVPAWVAWQSDNGGGDYQSNSLFWGGCMVPLGLVCMGNCRLCSFLEEWQSIKARPPSMMLVPRSNSTRSLQNHSGKIFGWEIHTDTWGAGHFVVLSVSALKNEKIQLACTSMATVSVHTIKLWLTAYLNGFKVHLLSSTSNSHRSCARYCSGYYCTLNVQITVVST